MAGNRLQSMTLATLLLLASMGETIGQAGGGQGGGGNGGGTTSSTTGAGGAAIGGSQSPGATGATGNPEASAPGPVRLPLRSSRPSADRSNDSQGEFRTAPDVPPGATGSSGDPGITGSTTPRQGTSSGGSLGDQTGLGNIGPETGREKKAQEESDKATRSICIGCMPGRD